MEIENVDNDSGSRGSMPMTPEEELARILKLLQGAIRLSEFSQTEVDEKIGRRRGYLSHVFQGVVDLKLKDLLRALNALGIESRDFFIAAVREGGDAKPSPTEVIRLMGEQVGTRKSQPPRELPRSEEELRAMVRGVAQQLLEQWQQGDARGQSGSGT